MTSNDDMFVCAACRYRGPMSAWEELALLSNEKRKVICCPNCTTVRTTTKPVVTGDHD